MHMIYSLLSSGGTDFSPSLQAQSGHTGSSPSLCGACKYVHMALSDTMQLRLLWQNIPTANQIPCDV